MVTEPQPARSLGQLLQDFPGLRGSANTAADIIHLKASRVLLPVTSGVSQTRVQPHSILSRRIVAPQDGANQMWMQEFICSPRVLQLTLKTSKATKEQYGQLFSGRNADTYRSTGSDCRHHKTELHRLTDSHRILFGGGRDPFSIVHEQGAMLASGVCVQRCRGAPTDEHVYVRVVTLLASQFRPWHVDAQAQASQQPGLEGATNRACIARYSGTSSRSVHCHGA